MTSTARDAIARVAPLIADATRPTKLRIRLLWAAAKQARNLAEPDATFDTLMTLAVETGLIDRAGFWTGADVRDTHRRFGARDVAHVVKWALRGWNPFEDGKLK